jgi:hypothetical protein
VLQWTWAVIIPPAFQKPGTYWNGLGDVGASIDGQNISAYYYWCDLDNGPSVEYVFGGYVQIHSIESSTMTLTFCNWISAFYDDGAMMTGYGLNLDGTRISNRCSD